MGVEPGRQSSLNDPLPSPQRISDPFDGVLVQRFASFVGSAQLAVDRKHRHSMDD